MKNSSLFQQLKEHAKSDIYPYHMPGHKRNPNLTDMASYYDIDITEIDGFDNLHDAEGILKAIEEKASRFYQAAQAKLLINGSTVGVLASILGCTKRGDSILIARNCHKSVYHAAYMNALNIEYLMPEIVKPWNLPGVIEPKQVKEALKANPKCKVVVITSPTYEGIILPVKEIANIVHEQNGILIVDSAHGAHLGFSKVVAQNVLKEGADIAIVSLHKTIPAMTQTSLLMFGDCFMVADKQPAKNSVIRYLKMLQSSSPSYVLMASMESALEYMKNEGEAALISMAKSLQGMCMRIQDCRHIGIAGLDATGSYAFDKGNWDPGKIIIYSKDGSLSGQEIYERLLKEFHLQMELATKKYVLAMFTVADTPEAYERLEKAIFQMDKSLDCILEANLKESSDDEFGDEFELPKVKLPLYQAMDAEYQVYPLDQIKEGMIAADFINIYPPGTPIYVPGEELTESGIEQLKIMKKMGLNLQGVSEEGLIKIVK